MFGDKIVALSRYMIPENFIILRAIATDVRRISMSEYSSCVPINHLSIHDDSSFWFSDILNVEHSFSTIVFSDTNTDGISVSIPEKAISDYYSYKYDKKYMKYAMGHAHIYNVTLLTKYYGMSMLTDILNKSN